MYLRYKLTLFCACVIAISALPLSAQFRVIEYGFKGGVPLNHLTQPGNLSDSSLRFTGGGMLQLNLPFGVAIEGDALYKRPGIKGTVDAFLTSPATEVDERFSQWEFPVLAKVYPLGRNPLIQPYGGAGISFRHTRSAATGADQGYTDRGFVLSAGIRNGVGKIKISPELRYTRWFSTAPLMIGSRGYFAETGENQVEFLVGISF
jgi:hypothetical protein